MAQLTGDTIELGDLEELVLGNNDDLRALFDPAEDGWVYYDGDPQDAASQQLMIVRRNGEVEIPIKADLTDADINRLVSDLSADGNNINAIDTASATTVDTANIGGSIVDGGGDISRLPGAGLSINGGDLAVTASFSGISGISNPLTADLNADGFDIQNVKRTETEELTDDDPINLVSTSFENAGHNEVDVPQVRNLTVTDFESGTLEDDAYTVQVGTATVQDSTTLDGNYSLKLDMPSVNTEARVVSNGGLSAYPQLGDKGTFYVQATDTDDKIFVNISDNITLRIQPAFNSIGIVDRDSGDTATAGAQLSSNLNEPLRVEWSSSDSGTFEFTVYNSSNTELGSVSANLKLGNALLQFRVNNVNVQSTAYFDFPQVKRRSPEYFADTKKGTTELGNDVQPSGEISTGSLAAPDDALRAKYAEAPVTTDSTQGDESILTLFESAANPSVMLRRILDGSGGSYANQLDGALGRFARLNANLSWEYDTLADVPNWDSGDGGVSSWTYNVNSRPRRIHVEHDGTGGSRDEGGVMANSIITQESLDAFRVTFHNVSFSENDESNSAYRVGLSNVSDASVDSFDNGEGILFRQYLNGPADYMYVIDDGGDTPSGSLGNLDWTQTHDFTIEYDGSTVVGYVDGGSRVTINTTITHDFRPIIQLEERPTSSAGETLEVEQITVEPLPEVLQ